MEQILWVEKYRPRTVNDCILPSYLKATFQGMATKNFIPNMTLFGESGMGKTTIARAICDELNIDPLFINSSDERGIDVLRTKVKSYASSMSFDGKRKVVILDEADQMTPEAQGTLRGIIEEFINNCSFILTCNYSNKILPAIRSRCPVQEFKIPKDEKKDIYKQLFERICNILQEENVTYDKKIIVELIGKFFPDFRVLLNRLQIFAQDNGEINTGVLASFSEIDVNSLFKHLKQKEYSDTREWVVQNLDSDPMRIYRQIYDGLKPHMKTTSIPKAVILLSEYQYRSAFSVDQEICLMAFLTQLMAQCEWT